MKIKDLLELEESDHGMPVSVISKACVSSIKETAGGSQVVYLQQGKEKIKCVLKCKNLFLKNDEIGKYITIRGSKAGDPSPSVTFSMVDGKRSVKVGKGADVIYSDSPEDKADPPKEVKHEPKKEEVQLTEEEEEILDDVIAGPSDAIIVECFYERLHIFQILQNLNRQYGEPFTKDALYPMVTSISIDANRAGKKILPPVGSKQTKKKKFDKIDKPHNPTKSYNGDPFVDFVISQEDQEWHDTETKEGKIGDLIKIPESRRKMMLFYFKNRANPTKQLKAMSASIQTALHSMYSSASSSIQNYLATDAILADQADITGLNIDEDYDELVRLGSDAVVRFQGSLSTDNLRGIATNYFKAETDKRDVR